VMEMMKETSKEKTAAAEPKADAKAK